MPAPSREVEYWDRFDGGLNLTTQTQSLGKSETPDCLNVDFGMRGGFATRGGFQTQETDAALSGAKFIGAGFTTDDVLLVQASDGSLEEWDGSTLVDTGLAVTDTTDRVRMATYAKSGSAAADGVIFLANGRSGGNIIMQTWDGTTLSTVTNAWDNNYAAPSGTNLPLARYITEHQNHFFVADTVESGTRYAARLRWSHLGRATSWAEDDWTYVGDTSAGDPITSLVPFQDRLLIFKKESVWALYGYDRDTFVLEQIADATGTCTCGAIAVNSAIAYWFSTTGQLMAYNGSQVTFLSQPLEYWSQTGKIQHGGAHRLMWSDGRLYMSLEAGAGEDVTRWLFIWDPTIKAFTRYDREVTDLIHWTRIGEDGDPLFLEVGDSNLYRYDQSYKVDIDDTGTLPIRARFRTAWLRAGETATKKRWKRPRVTAAASADATITMKVFTDFEDVEYSRSQQFSITVPDVATLWGTMDWNDNWYKGADEYYEFARLPSSGSAYAVSYEFSSSDNLGRWWVDSIAVPFRRKQVR